MKVDRRTELREVTFLILFRLFFYEKNEVESQIKSFFENEDNFTDAEKQYIGNKVLTIMDVVPEIDAELDKVSIGWKTKRMSKVDLTILRLAFFEIKFDESIPNSTSINEAVELAKNYGEDSSSSFVNGILAKVVSNENWKEYLFSKSSK